MPSKKQRAKNSKNAKNAKTARKPTPILCGTVREVLAHPSINLEDKGRIFKCFRRIHSAGMVSAMPLKQGDTVTLTGLTTDQSLNGEQGLLGTFEKGRWNVLLVNKRVRPRNLMKKEWLEDGNFNTSISINGTNFIMRVDPDETVRCLTPSGMEGVHEIRAKFPWDDFWMIGFNREAPEDSDLYIE